MKLLDPSYVATLSDITPEQKVELRANAVKGLAKLKYQPALERIREVSEGDPMPAVQSAALEALKNF
jgi:HEAT repeat protein